MIALDLPGTLVNICVGISRFLITIIFCISSSLTAMQIHNFGKLGHTTYDLIVNWLNCAANGATTRDYQDNVSLTQDIYLYKPYTSILTAAPVFICSILNTEFVVYP